MALEQTLYTYLTALVAAADENSALSGAAVKQTAYGSVTTNKVIEIGPCSPDVAPLPGNDELGEFDAELTLVLLRLVEVPPAGADADAAYAAARDEAIAMGAAIGLAVVDNNTLGGVLIDALPIKLLRDFTTVKQQPFAVANLVLLINPTGSMLEDS
jgi:hypothetical protein